MEKIVTRTKSAPRAAAGGSEPSANKKARTKAASAKAKPTKTAKPAAARPYHHGNLREVVIAAAVDLPVTADLEAAGGRGPHRVERLLFVGTNERDRRADDGRVHRVDDGAFRLPERISARDEKERARRRPQVATP